MLYKNMALTLNDYEIETPLNLKKKETEQWLRILDELQDYTIDKAIENLTFGILYTERDIVDLRDFLSGYVTNAEKGRYLAGIRRDKRTIKLFNLLKTELENV